MKRLILCIMHHEKFYSAMKLSFHEFMVRLHTRLLLPNSAFRPNTTAVTLGVYRTLVAGIKVFTTFLPNDECVAGKRKRNDKSNSPGVVVSIETN